MIDKKAGRRYEQMNELYQYRRTDN